MGETRRIRRLVFLFSSDRTESFERTESIFGSRVLNFSISNDYYYRSFSSRWYSISLLVLVGITPACDSGVAYPVPFFSFEEEYLLATLPTPAIVIIVWVYTHCTRSLKCKQDCVCVFACRERIIGA